jgi:hypothetical protein
VNANIVRGNDNQIQQAFNSHDLDATVHVQSSALADRPAAGVVGRTWVTNDSGTYEHWYDDGTSWQRIYGVDYEEGTWTPTYFAATTDFTSVTYGAGTGGSYVKINETVWIEAFIRTSGITGGVGRVEIRSLPFAIAGRNNFYIGGASNFNVNNPSESYALPGAEQEFLANLRLLQDKLMAITEETVIDKIEVVGAHSFVQVRKAYVLSRDGVEIGRTFHRHTLFPGDDLSGEDPRVVAVCNAVWTDDVLQEYQNYLTSLDDAL